MKKKFFSICIALMGSILVSCSSNDNSLNNEQNSVTETIEPTESLTVTPTATVTASQTPTEVSTRLGSRTNVMKIGDSITLPYSDWNSNSDGEITVSAISNQDGKTTVKMTIPKYIYMDNRSTSE